MKYITTIEWECPEPHLSQLDYHFYSIGKKIEMILNDYNSDIIVQTLITKEDVKNDDDPDTEHLLLFEFQTYDKRGRPILGKKYEKRYLKLKEGSLSINVRKWSDPVLNPEYLKIAKNRKKKDDQNDSK